jgi:methyl-accepting chemotaxis protein
MPSGTGLSWFLGRLRIQFTLYVAAILVAFTAVVLAINWQSQEQIVLDRLEAHVGYVADLTAILVQEKLEDGDASALASVLNEIVELEDAMAVAVVAPDGIVQASERGVATSPSLIVPSGTILTGSPWPNSSSRSDAEYIFAMAPVRVGDSVVATVHLARALLRSGTQPGSSILSNAEFGAEASSLQQIITRNVLIGLGMFALAIPLAGFLMNRATRGISDVTDAARQAAEGNLDVVLATSGSGEVVELQTSFRKMQEELKTNIREIETLAYTDSVFPVNANGTN